MNYAWMGYFMAMIKKTWDDNFCQLENNICNPTKPVNSAKAARNF